MGLEQFSDEVRHQIEKIVMITERINNYRGRIPAIEVDLAMEEIRKLYNCFLALKSTGGEADQIREDVSVSVPEEKPVTVKGDKAEQDNDVAEALVEEVNEEEPAMTDSPEPADEDKSKHGVVPEAAQGKEPGEKTAEKGQKGAILAEKLTRSGHKSINDLISAGRMDVSISSRMQHNPISNLKSAIGINEKFIFVYELFDGNTQRYSEVIDRLNNMPGREEAIVLMESLREEFRWDIENMAFQKLVDMVARRYS